MKLNVRYGRWLLCWKKIYKSRGYAGVNGKTYISSHVDFKHKKGVWHMLKEKVWFITGCSTGFGRAIAEAAIKVGYKVVVTARNRDAITDLTRGNEANTAALSLDVTSPEQIKQAVSNALEKFGRIDVLVNNAGIGYFSSVEESIEEETRRMFEINFWGLMHVTRAVLPGMRSQRSGHIINFSSIGGLAAFPLLGYYHATKFAVEGISETLSQEVAPLNIHVTLIEPSGFRTDWSGRSSVKTSVAIEDYKATLTPMFDMMVGASGHQAGDPKRAADAIVGVVESEKPPLRLLLGNDAYQVAVNKFPNLLTLIEEQKTITTGTDFPKS
jgi:NADP-dependent 3-hydroxy acid dehydrogenase YdfG